MRIEVTTATKMIHMLRPLVFTGQITGDPNIRTKCSVNLNNPNFNFRIFLYGTKTWFSEREARGATHRGRNWVRGTKHYRLSSNFRGNADLYFFCSPEIQNGFLVTLSSIIQTPMRVEQPVILADVQDKNTQEKCSSENYRQDASIEFGWKHGVEILFVARLL